MAGENRSGRGEGQPSFAPLYAQEPTPRAMPLAWRLGGPVMAAIHHGIQDVHVRSLASLPEGPMLIVANRTGFLDPTNIGIPLFEVDIAPRFVVPAQAAHGHLAGRILRATRNIPVPESNERPGDFDVNGPAIAAVGEAFESGDCVCIFPEGAFTVDPDGWAMRAPVGAARIVLAYPDVPVIPMVHWGNAGIIDPWTKRPNLRRLGRKTTRLDVHVGSPIDLSEYYGRDATDEVLHGISDTIMNAINDVLEEIRAHDRAWAAVPRRDHLWDWAENADGYPFAEHEAAYRPTLLDQLEGEFTRPSQRR